MDDGIGDRLLERYCAGDATSSERADVERWIAADPARAAYVERMRAAWREAAAMERPPERPDVAAAWERVQRRVQWTGRPPLRIASGGAPPRRSVWRRLISGPGLAAAAALAVTVGAALVVPRLPGGRPGGGPGGVPVSAAREVVTRRGQRAVFDLPDGSRVVIAAESRLRIPETYQAGAGARDVHLDGEAFFEVTHDSTRPFRVHTANGIAEDLGTEFVVTAYPETKGMQVVVASGVVALWRGARPLLTLTRGDLAHLDPAGVATLTRGVPVAPHLAWASGSLVFDGARLRDVLPRLARWYDLDIRLADSALAERRLTATFRDETAAQMLALLALSLDVRVEQDGRSVVLSRKTP